MTTVRAEIAGALRRAARHDSSQVAPAVVLWADPDRTWEALIPQIQEAVPVLVLGEHDVDAARGPAIWLRAVIVGTDDRNHVQTTRADGVPEALRLPSHLAAPGGRNPWVLYLPGVSRADLAEASAAPRALAPLVELQFRSVWWQQSNGQPWTPQAFLRSPDGLALAVARDTATSAAVAEVLGTLLDRDVDALRAGPVLDAGRLHAMVVPDSVREVLAWIDDPAAVRSRLIGPSWTAFASACRAEFGLDPAKDTPITAASLLGRRQGSWAVVWGRFTEAVDRYPTIPERLDQASPGSALFGEDDPHPDSWPARNADRENVLRDALVAVAQSSTRDLALTAVRRLHDEHRDRLGRVWDALGKAPLARAAAHLANLADAVATPLPVGTVDELATWYAVDGHRADDLALRSVAEAHSSADRTAVLAALGAVYDPWVDTTATAFQTAARAGYRGESGLEIAPGTCVLFVDALRMDLGHRLVGGLASAGLTCDLGRRLAAFPTVTPTGQPAVAPLSSPLGAGPDFCAGDSRGRAVTGQVFRGALTQAGVQFLDPTATGDPAGRGWTQTNTIDSLGHQHDHKLAGLLEAELASLVERVGSLLGAGWARVVVVTDHGWLLPARPARKVDLPLHLTEAETARKPRVARLKAGQQANFPTLPWTWDGTVSMVSAPGASAFEAGALYEHGGISPQECVIPVITVTSTAPSELEARIEALRWTAMRCRIDVAPPIPGLSVEVRLSAGDPASSIAGPKAVVDGEARLLVADDAHDRSDVHVVLLDSTGDVIAQRSTRVGENP